MSRAVQQGLRRRNPAIDVLRVGDPGAPPAGSSDPDILIWIEEHSYVLVTGNRSTIPSHLADHFTAGRHVPGVLWIRPRTPVGQVIEELFVIWSASSLEEYRDRSLFIPL